MNAIVDKCQGCELKIVDIKACDKCRNPDFEMIALDLDNYLNRLK